MTQFSTKSLLVAMSLAFAGSASAATTWTDSFGKAVKDGNGNCLGAMNGSSSACEGKAVAAPAAKAAPAPVAAASTKEIINLASDVFFKFGSANLTANGEKAVGDLAAKMASVQSVSITGYADITGPEAYNQALSANRATAVKTALVKAGVDGAKISTTGAGETTQFGAKNADNRRVVIEITGAK
jgi:outer membrane protein OmpA-like peptidoglycan-associated protein